MGSTGSGNFTDYQGYFGNNPKQGGESKEDICEKAFQTELEDVETSEYYKSIGHLPEIKAEVSIDFNGHRIVAKVSGKEIGYLPTKYNYLRRCMEKFSYSGNINNTSATPIYLIIINVYPNV